MQQSVQQGRVNVVRGGVKKKGVVGEEMKRGDHREEVPFQRSAYVTSKSIKRRQRHSERRRNKDFLTHGHLQNDKGVKL